MANSIEVNRSLQAAELGAGAEHGGNPRLHAIRDGEKPDEGGNRIATKDRESENGRDGSDRHHLGDRADYPERVRRRVKAAITRPEARFEPGALVRLLRRGRP